MSFRDYDRLVMRYRPWGFWVCDEPSGSLRDRSGNGRDMSATGSPIYRSPIGFNGALGVRLQSGSSFATAVSLSMSGVTGWTILALLRPYAFATASPYRNRFVYHGGDDFGIQFGFGSLLANNAKLMAFNRSGAASYQEAQDSQARNAGEAMFVSGYWDGSNVGIKERGRTITTTSSGSTNGDSGTIQMIAENTASDFVIGRVAVFNALVQSNVHKTFHDALFAA